MRKSLLFNESDEKEVKGRKKLKVKDFSSLNELFEATFDQISFSSDYSLLEKTILKKEGRLTVDPIFLVSLLRNVEPSSEYFLKKKLVVWFSPALASLYKANSWIAERVKNIVLFYSSKEDFRSFSALASSRVVVLLEGDPFNKVVVSLIENLKRVIPPSASRIKKVGDPLEEIHDKKFIFVPAEQRKTRFKSFPLLKLLTELMVEEVVRWGRVVDKSS